MLIHVHLYLDIDYSFEEMNSGIILDSLLLRCYIGSKRLEAEGAMSQSAI